MTRWWFIEEGGLVARFPRLFLYTGEQISTDKIEFPGNIYIKESYGSYGIGGVRLFMTIGTPHRGSEWADIVAENPTLVNILRLVVGINKNIDAVSDLASDSFWVSGTAAKALARSKANVKSRYVGGIVDRQMFQGDNQWVRLRGLLKVVFGEPNDRVVGITSQGNGRRPEDRFVIQDTAHTEETSSAKLREIVRDLLQDKMLTLFDPSTNENIR
ncbi:MAG: hypothetical protein A2Z34_03180 [Planctomycetes bacterium RBG_16_59_8]|nr:MAG: hypothetical protein A2Z34_03180 [Planctomycetes bacterium RBG_16_59_8]